MKTIDLGRGVVTRVDDEDFARFGALGWRAQISGNTVYAVRTSHGKTTYLHRQIFPDAERVDHRDNDGLNNQRYNLRACTQKGNSANARKLKFGSSRYKGVHFYKRHGSWMAYIHPNGRKIHLGYYATEGEAALAYNFAALHHFGDFARLNEVSVC
jgi:AP2 domain/HNH endonuclease